MPLAATAKMRMSATGNKRAPPTAAGFTLIELVVVLAVIALVLALVPARLSAVSDNLAYRSTVRAVFTALRSARLAAQQRGEDVSFEVDLGSRSYTIDGHTQGSIPSSIDIRLTVAEREISPPLRAGIRFYPDGSATGGSIDLLRPDGNGTRLRVAWLHGRITQEALP